MESRGPKEEIAKTVTSSTVSTVTKALGLVASKTLGSLVSEILVNTPTAPSEKDCIPVTKQSQNPVKNESLSQYFDFIKNRPVKSNPQSKKSEVKQPEVKRESISQYFSAIRERRLPTRQQKTRHSIASKQTLTPQQNNTTTQQPQIGTPEWYKVNMPELYYGNPVTTSGGSNVTTGQGGLVSTDSRNSDYSRGNSWSGRGSSECRGKGCR